MNVAEKKVLHIAFVLLAVGVAVRMLPWGVPSMETVDIGERPKMAEAPVVSSKLEYGGAPPSDTITIEDKVTKKPKKKGRGGSRKKKAVVRLPLRINSATEDELCALKGVGPKLAERIIAFREAHGPFRDPASLQKVPGIGKKKLEGILQGVIFD